jgi:hypothetical protein
VLTYYTTNGELTQQKDRYAKTKSPRKRLEAVSVRFCSMPAGINGRTTPGENGRHIAPHWQPRPITQGLLPGTGLARRSFLSTPVLSLRGELVDESGSLHLLS